MRSSGAPCRRTYTRAVRKPNITCRIWRTEPDTKFSMFRPGAIAFPRRLDRAKRHPTSRRVDVGCRFALSGLRAEKSKLSLPYYRIPRTGSRLEQPLSVVLHHFYVYEIVYK